MSIVTLQARQIKDVTEVRVSLRHISEDGQRQDPKTGRFIPAGFIQQVLLKIDDRVIGECQLGGGLSHNPGFVFKLKNLKAGTRISAECIKTVEVSDPKSGAKTQKEVKDSASITLQAG